MKKILLLSTMLMAVFVFTSNAIAVDTLEKISDSGTFIVGARDGAIPFGFHNDQNEHVGFSLDLAKEFHKALEEKIGKTLELKTIVVNPKTRIPLVANGNVHIVTGSATHTIPREDTVDFSLTFFLTGSQLLVKKDKGYASVKDLSGKKIGAAQGSTNEKTIRELNKSGYFNPEAKLVIYQEHTQGMLALNNGIIEAYCGDGSHLAGMKSKVKDSDNYIIIGEMLSYDPYAFILPENDSNFRDFINEQLIRMFVDGRYMTYYDKWFGANGVVPFPMTDDFRTLIKLQSWPL
jgi:polar amino acid transport system substrate-binding protein/glutamate/aspartate transport system substrate-binding protein